MPPKFPSCVGHERSGTRKRRAGNEESDGSVRPGGSHDGPQGNNPASAGVAQLEQVTTMPLD